MDDIDKPPIDPHRIAGNPFADKADAFVKTNGAVVIGVSIEFHPMETDFP